MSAALPWERGYASAAPCTEEPPAACGWERVAPSIATAEERVAAALRVRLADPALIVTVVEHVDQRGVRMARLTAASATTALIDATLECPDGDAAETWARLLC